MARTTVAEVKQIMDNCTVSDTIIDVFIVSANGVVTEAMGGTNAGATLLEEVERWFTAHMLAMTLCRTTTEEKLGEAAVKYTGVFKDGLASTPYGQMVMQIDYTGTMANIGKGKASMYALTSFD